MDIFAWVHYTLFQKQVVNTFSVYSYPVVNKNMMQVPEATTDVYGYRGNFLVDETFKDFAHSVCVEHELQYPPLSHEDALYLYFIRM